MAEKLKKQLNKLSISQTVALAFSTVIVIGTLLLMLPVSSRSGSCTDFLTAFFTATSATCVTGLSTVDTYTQWSFFGQAVILTMIEIGGLGFMSAISIVIFALRRKIEFRHLLFMAQAVGAEDLNDVQHVQKRIIKGSLAVEAAGALLLFARFAHSYEAPKALWMGIFHSVSAYCNAGFDILGFIEPGASMAAFRTDLAVNLTLMALIIIGGLGFLVWDEMFKEHNPRTWSVYTRLVLIVNAVLLVGGTLLFYLFERSNPATLGALNEGQKWLAAAFQSVTTRTAGFASIDQALFTDPGKAVTMVLMFIGGSSGSTAGGAKTITVLVMILFLYTRMRGRREIRVFYRAVSQQQVVDALTLTGLMTTLIIGSSVLICSFSHISLLEAVFESISAIATVGISLGVTAQLSLISKLIIIVFMFLGRVGIMTICISFLQNKETETYHYPKTNLLIG